VFTEPWEAQAFAMVVALHQRGLFTWPEWAAALAAQLADAAADANAHEHEHAPADTGSRYYRHWLAALEAIVAAKGAGSAGELGRYRSAWAQAAERTPHGQPIELQAGDFPAG